MQQDLQHPEPLWRDRADFIIGVALDEGGATEQLWARRLSEHEFELCCVPLYVYGFALGDRVETDAEYTVTRKVQSSGRLTYRVWLGDSPRPREEAVAAIEATGAAVERGSVNLLGVDAADEQQGEHVVSCLEALAAGGVVWEAGF